ncbi:MAG TPA: glycosyltransferase family 2 protein [Bacteroidales bacterium]|nr:glycosyltransferase family 2 protein [Bacteroidales bacterium]HRZ49112.1 glycosyltransferase family 2 protein [Bacteroidales bacterium]
MKPLLSIVIIAYNEETNAALLIRQILNLLNDTDFEVVFVDDGSTDNTLAEVREIADSRLQIIEFKRNFGQSAALSAGIEYARGAFIVTMDADLQNDPADILPMLEKIQQGNHDLVAGIRKNRKDGFFLRRLPSLMANAIIRRSTGIRIRDYGCTLKIFRSELAQNLSIYGELHRFIPVLASLEGASISQMEVQHHARIHGKSKYGLNRSFKVISDLLLLLFFRKYMNRPMHLFGLIGLLLFAGGAAIELYLFIIKLMGADIWGKPVMILGVILLILGIQFITIGIIAEMLMRTYYESQNKKPYKIRNISRGKDQD